MWLLMVIEVVTFLLFVVFTITQVVVPLWNGKPLFPLLRSRQRELSKEFAEAGEDVDTAHVEQDIERRRRTATRIRTASSPGRRDNS